jgi:hypothetical protein
MHERYIRCFLRKGFKRDGCERGAVAGKCADGDFPALDIARVERAFFAGCEDVDDATEGRGVL